MDPISTDKPSNNDVRLQGYFDELFSSDEQGLQHLFDALDQPSEPNITAIAPLESLRGPMVRAMSLQHGLSLLSRDDLLLSALQLSSLAKGLATSKLKAVILAQGAALFTQFKAQEQAQE